MDRNTIDSLAKTHTIPMQKDFRAKMIHISAKMIDFSVKMIDFSAKMIDFSAKMIDFSAKMIECIAKLIDLFGISRDTQDKPRHVAKHIQNQPEHVRISRDTFQKIT